MSNQTNNTPQDTQVPQKTLHKYLDFAAAEQYKLLRENLSFILPPDSKSCIIGVTSAMRGDGKSTTAINLAYALAENGKKVMLIDGDLRLPSISKKLDIAPSPGLTDCLKGEEKQQLSIFKSGVLNNWYIMPAGDLPPNPSELLGSVRMESVLKVLSDTFDYIVLDLPPINMVSDALAVSKFITGLIVVVRENYTEKSEIDACFRQLELGNVNVLGCVMNEAGNEATKYKRYRKYGKYGKYGRYSRYGRYYSKYYKSYGYYSKDANKN